MITYSIEDVATFDEMSGLSKKAQLEIEWFNKRDFYQELAEQEALNDLLGTLPDKTDN
jgi:hypothetical protein